MNLTVRDIAFSVFGAYRLARFDQTGVDFLERTPDGALKSFYAGLLVLPGYGLLLAIRLWEQIQGVSLAQVLTVEAIAYVVSWTAFPVIMYQICAILGRADRFVGFLCAYNWSSVVQVSVYLPTVVLAESGALPDGVAQALVFGVTMAMLTYQWFILRTTLEVSGIAAAGLVVLDMFTAALITDYADGLL